MFAGINYGNLIKTNNFNLYSAKNPALYGVGPTQTHFRASR